MSFIITDVSPIFWNLSFLFLFDFFSFLSFQKDDTSSEENVSGKKREAYFSSFLLIEIPNSIDSIYTHSNQEWSFWHGKIYDEKEPERKKNSS